MTADVRTDFSVWVSFSTSRIVLLHIIFRWLVNWDIAGFNILACFNVFRLVRLCLRLLHWYTGSAGDTENPGSTDTARAWGAARNA